MLTILFFFTAVFYSSVGFGGGSTYLALLLVWEVPYFVLPIIALLCNIVVVSGNCFNYIKNRKLNLQLLIPYIIGSIPFAFIGGSLHIEKKTFEILLFFVLLTAGILLSLNFNSYNNNKENYKKIPTPIAIIIGSFLGLISGVVGIGGGIFLSPILFIIKAGMPRNIITTTSIFILINSIFGIFGQLTKSEVFNEVFVYWYLLIAVIVGGQIGNYLNLKVFSTKILALITSLLVILVAIKMGVKIFS